MALLVEVAILLHRQLIIVLVSVSLTKPYFHDSE